MWDMRVSDPIPPPLSRSAIPVARSVGTSPVFVLNKVSDAGGTPATSVPLMAQAGPCSHPSWVPSPNHTSHW